MLSNFLLQTVHHTAAALSLLLLLPLPLLLLSLIILDTTYDVIKIIMYVYRIELRPSLWHHSQDEL